MIEPLRILIVDDHEVFRRGLGALIEDESDFLLVGEAGSGEEAVGVCLREHPDVVLMDIHMPGGDGIQAVRQIKQLTNAHVLMLTVSEKDEDLIGAIEAGADGYLLKNAKPGQLSDGIRRVAAGQGVLSPEVTPALLRSVAGSQRGKSAVRLSAREGEVLALLARGATTAQVAAALTVSENTVKTHVHRILRKLDASNRTEAVARAVALGLLYDGG